MQDVPDPDTFAALAGDERNRAILTLPIFRHPKVGSKELYFLPAIAMLPEAANGIGTMLRLHTSEPSK